MKNFFLLLIIGILAGIAVKYFALEIFTVPTNSMEPTIVTGSKIWLNKLPLTSFKKKDIVAFEKGGENFVKRIIGVPNDSVYFDGQKFQVFKIGTIVYKIPKKGDTFTFDKNNFDFYKPLIEHYENVQAGYIINKIFINNTETNNYTFKYNYYFLQGDNIEESLDSRNFGLISEKNLFGKVLFYY